MLKQKHPISIVWTVEIMQVAEILRTILNKMAWLNVVAEKSELMILSGEVLYRFYRYQSAYQLYKTATNAHINITKKAL